MIRREKSHKEQIERWANFVRKNPDKWKKDHTLFTDSQIIKANKFYSGLDLDLVRKLRKIK